MVRDDEVCSTSSMRFAHTEARGHMTMSMTAIMTLMRISMRYVVNEAKMPTSVCPSSIRVAANQNTAIWDRFMMSMTRGNIAAIVRPTFTWMSRREELVASKRAASWRSRAKARTTRMPVICSRTTRLRSSMRFC